MAQIYKRKSDFVSAIRIYSEVLRIQVRAHGLNHIDIAWTLSSVRLIHYQLNDHLAVFDCYQEVLRIRHQHYSDDHEEVSSTLNSAGLVPNKVSIE